MSSSTSAVVQNLTEVLSGATGDRTALATSVLPALLDSIASVASALRAAHHVALAGGTNAFGDDQLNVDVTAENLIREALARCSTVATASSEEDPIERPMSSVLSTSAETYTVAFDPLDGSSIIAPNWTVGTIAGVWDGTTALGSRPANAQIASVLGVYGPRTTALIALRVPGTKPVCIDLCYTDATSSWDIVPHQVALAKDARTKYFAPANARAAAEDARYRDLITHYITSKYTLRYSGGLVPDLVHILTKGHGIYLSPVTAASKAKLRRLYELCPVALLLECVGGQAVDAATGLSVLDTPLADTDERGGLVCGTAEEVDKAMEWLRRAE
jgi:sedoheptulose-bisphosphatase